MEREQELERERELELERELDLEHEREQDLEHEREQDLEQEQEQEREQEQEQEQEQERELELEREQEQERDLELEREQEHMNQSVARIGCDFETASDEDIEAAVTMHDSLADNSFYREHKEAVESLRRSAIRSTLQLDSRDEENLKELIFDLMLKAGRAMNDWYRGHIAKQIAEAEKVLEEKCRSR